MQLHELKPIHKFKKPKRIGRGGKRGGPSGRGVQGKTASPPPIRELIKKYPKLRGYRMKFQIPKSKSQTIFNLDILEKKFNVGEKVTPEILLEKKIIRKIKGRMPQVKLLGGGELTKALTIEGCQASKSAKEKIKKAEGTVK